MSPLAAHLWQSTWFALVAGLLAWNMRKEPARIRYWIWFTALAKFAVPFALLAALGRQFVVQVETYDGLLPFMRDAAAPFVFHEFASVHLAPPVLVLIAILWALGTMHGLTRWLFEWLRVRRIAERGAFVMMRARVPLISSDDVLEPGVFGVRRPVMLIPTALLYQLEPKELDAVIAHELQHVDRRDNALAAIQTLIQALFWFHPLVWWLGARMTETREQACDEAVVEVGHNRETYAQAMVSVCRHALKLRSMCVAHAAGGNLVERIAALASNPPTSSALRVSLLVSVAIATIALAVASGVSVISTSQFSVAAGSHTIRVSRDSGPTFVAATNDALYARNVSLRELIGHVYSIRASQVQGRLPALDQPRYDVELSPPSGVHIDHRELVASALDERFNLEVIAFPTPKAQ